MGRKDCSHRHSYFVSRKIIIVLKLDKFSFRKEYKLKDINNNDNNTRYYISCKRRYARPKKKNHIVVPQDPTHRHRPVWSYVTVKKIIAQIHCCCTLAVALNLLLLQIPRRALSYACVITIIYNIMRYALTDSANLSARTLSRDNYRLSLLSIPVGAHTSVLNI